MGNTRQTELTVDLGGDAKLIRLEATEGLSQPFTFELDVFVPSPGAPIKLLDHLGKPVHVSVKDAGKLLRDFHGIIVDGEFLHHREEVGYFYKLTVRPRAYLYEHNRNYRAFDKKDARFIIKTILDECGVKHKMDGLTGGEDVRQHTVQYGESDFGFVSRLMEEEGIYYFYEHSADEHTMMLCDSPVAHVPGEAATMRYDPARDNAPGEEAQAIVVSWQERVSTGAEKMARTIDYDFKQTRQPLIVESPTEHVHDLDDLEVTQFPGRFYDKGIGLKRGTALIESRRANRSIFTGESDATEIVVGTTFTLNNHDIDDYNAEYLVTQTRHGIATETYRSNMGYAGDDGVWFEAVPADTHWRAPMTSRRPVVPGPETAIVIGDGGDNEVETEEYGRVKVQFHWDREGLDLKRNRNDWCWVRVSQIGHMGSIILPRIGQEVLVDFINGDPDRPVVTGRLFNQEHRPLYELPDNRSRAVWRSQVMGAGQSQDEPKGSSDEEWSPFGGNEITLEDLSGAEEIMMRAQRAMNFYIHENFKRIIDKDEIAEIANDQKIHVSNNIQITGDNQIELICGSSKITMTQNDITIEATQIKVKGQASVEIGAPDTKVNGDSMLTLKGGMVFIN